MRSNQRPVIIRKVEQVDEGGHHGGAWKVAYADFMTAMMAFFLMLWILSTASKEQLVGVANYFTPSAVSMTSSGGTGALDGTTLGPKGTLNASNGITAPKGPDAKAEKDRPEEPTADAKKAAAMLAAAALPEGQAKPAAKAPAPAAKPDAATLAAAAHALDDKRFAKVETEITQAMDSAPDLKPLLKNVLFQKSPDGLRIQIVDQKGRAMFASGSAKIEGKTLALMQGLARAIKTLPNDILISGHTDAVPYSDSTVHDNWELSSNRANATRRVFVEAGIDPKRITRISGLADTQPLKPENPLDPSNRRISVLLAYTKAEAGANTAAKDVGAAGPAAEAPVAQATPPAPQAGAPATRSPAAPAPQQSPAVASAAPAPAPKDGAQNVAPAAAPTVKQDPLAQQYSSISLDDLRKSLE
ncbi:flagellar motor protein MotB [Acidimangrovimonas pyrenivorans]|uniref:Flagellar motor protein MotB n=1 Tax=Acidimangrovimonas pyrenivorans TaxID=2030798 RepID=A0ABV7ANC4_9RHOB